MSYDIYSYDDDGLDVIDWNYTSNMSEAWRAAGVDFTDWQDKRCGEVIDELRKAIEIMAKNFDEYSETYDSPNGWGSMETLVPSLASLWISLMRNPDARLGVWY